MAGSSYRPLPVRRRHLDCWCDWTMMIFIGELRTMGRHVTLRHHNFNFRCFVLLTFSKCTYNSFVHYFELESTRSPRSHSRRRHQAKHPQNRRRLVTPPKVLVHKIKLLTLRPWPLTFEPQNSTTSRIPQGDTLYQAWTLWDHSFLSYAADKQTDKQTDSKILYPRRPT